MNGDRNQGVPSEAGGRFEFLYVDLVEVTVRLPYRGGSSRNQRTRFQTRDEID